MKILKYFMSLVAAAGLVTSCSSDLDTVCVLSPENAVAPVLHDMGVSEITFTSKNLTETLEVEWDAADFGVDAAISYSLRAAYEGNEVVVLATSETKASVTYEALNQSLALAVEDGGLGVPADVPTEVAFRVAATVGSNYNLLYSATQNITVTTTSAEKTYDTYYVVGTLNGWDHATVAKEFDFLYNFAGDGNLYEGIVDLGDDYATAEFKFTKGAWGDGEHSMADGQEEAEASSIALVAGGGGSNINLYKANRFYHFSLDLAGLTLKKNYSFNTIGVVGTINDWGGTPDVEMTYNASKRRFYADVEVAADGEVKFRADNTWGACEYGGADGTLQAGGANIPVAAGNYRFYIYLSNPSELTYEINADMFGKEEPTAQAPADPEDPETPEPSNGFKIYAYSEDGWTNMNLYGWITDPITASWPGTKMSVEKVNGLDFFVAQIPAEYNNVTINIIFNNGSEQTNDITGVVVDKDLYFAVKGKSATQIDPATYTPAPPATSEASKLYLKPNMWNSDSPRFEAYFFGNGEKWVTMTPSEVSGAFECELPEGYPNVIFIRMDPNKPEHNWDSKWNQTSDLTIPTDGKNCYSVPQDVWDNADNSGWTTI